jgi:hypothetical protein
MEVAISLQFGAGEELSLCIYLAQLSENEASYFTWDLVFNGDLLFPYGSAEGQNL